MNKGHEDRKSFDQEQFHGQMVHHPVLMGHTFPTIVRPPFSASKMKVKVVC